MEFPLLNIVGLAVSLIAIFASLVSKILVEKRSLSKRSIRIKVGGISVEIKGGDVSELENALDKLAKLDKQRTSADSSSGGEK